MTKENKPPVIRIDLQNKTLSESIAIINAIFSSRSILEEMGLKLYIKKKTKKPRTP